MAFSVAKSRPFRSLGLYKSTGKHAAPKGAAPAPRTERGSAVEAAGNSPVGSDVATGDVAVSEATVDNGTEKEAA